MNRQPQYVPVLMKVRGLLFVVASFVLGLEIAPIKWIDRDLSTIVEIRPPKVKILSMYDEIRNQTTVAEQEWKQGKGYIYLQHARKAGGTTLCMILRDNAKGLVQSSADRTAKYTKRETCQIKSLCSDCDLKRKFANETSLEPIVRNAMKKTRRNMFEAEGFGVPADILSDRWSNYVFISSIRHPITRIESSLRNDRRFRDCQSMTGTALSSCLSDYVSSERAILDECSKNIYFCHSNYLVRMFSGMERNYTNDDDMLERAKRNWYRFSCVILQEHWSETIDCLGNRLGLYRHSNRAFNVNGNLRLRTVDGVRTNNTGRSELLFTEDYERLLSLNQNDLKFYEWAKAQILQSASGSYDQPIPKNK